MLSSAWRSHLYRPQVYGKADGLTINGYIDTNTNVNVGDDAVLAAGIKVTLMTPFPLAWWYAPEPPVMV